MNSEINKIYEVCKNIVKNKYSREVDVLFIEELSELIKAISKLQRFDYNDKQLRNEYSEIYDNLYEEIGDVIIMLLQFICKNKLSEQIIYDKISEKLIRYYETISDKK